MDVCQGDCEDISEKLEKCLSVDTEDQMEAYHRHIQDGKDAGRRGELKTALEFFKLAYDIHQSEKLERRIKKIEEHLCETESEQDDDFVDVNGSGLMLFKELYNKLYDYQRDGVAFLYSLYRDSRKGGILADDMGLGKTIQVISFLSGMYDNELAKHTLLIMPTSLVTNWTKEFAKWAPGMRVKVFHGDGKERTRDLEKVQRRSGVLITTYTMILNNWQQLSSYHGNEFAWDLVILDEAHKIKSAATKTAKSAYAIPSKNRILLTGTPVQNNLKEMWALFDFACQGTLLGAAKTFKMQYENPITRAREKDATPGEQVLGYCMSENLMAIIKPHFLRRTKAEVQKEKSNGTKHEEGRVPDPPKDSGAVMPTLKRKNDLIVWTYLSPVQEDIYRQFISLDHIKELLMTTRSPLAELTIMKKLCDHPRLFSATAQAKLGLEKSEQKDDVEADSGGIVNVPDETLIAESGKLVFLFALLERLREEGHRTLIFAHYRKVLDIIERILGNRGFKVLRLDGTVTQIAERERIITRFQSDRSYSVFLLTTQVGGVGITLTAANRVVIYDPSWNPATDAQAVDRAYRIGQTENVVIYRLITCGTVEEKIYRRQVFKDSLIRQNTGDAKNPFRYFSKQELKELFVLEDTRSSSTQLQLQALHARHRRTDPELDEHVAHLHAMEMFGISDHDLMFSLDVNQDQPPENQEEHHYIEGRVQKAQELMKAESELQMQLAENMASSTEPAWLRQPAPNNNQERSKRKKSTLSPSSPHQDRRFNKSPVVVEVDQSGSDKEDLGSPVIDLTAAEPDEHAEENQQEGSYLEPKGSSPPEVIQESLMSDTAGIVSVIEPMDESAMSKRAIVPAGDGSVALINDCSVAFIDKGIVPLQNKRLSVLKLDETDTLSRVGSGLESFEGNFNLELEESDVFPDPNVPDQPETDAKEVELLSRLQMEGSFDIHKSLSERQHREALGQSVAGVDHISEVDELVNDSLVVTKKKRAAVIYDSEEDEDDDKSRLSNSFRHLGASTPKSTPAGPAPLHSRKSVGGNTSVASRHSFILSIIEDTDFRPTDAASEDEEDVFGSTHDKLQLEEMVGGTLNTEGEEEKEEKEEEEAADAMDETGLETSSNMEESTSAPELTSDERMDQFTVKMNGIVLTEEEEKEEEKEESFDSLVTRGKEFKTKGKLDEALDFFLRAIDMKPGDPEVQLMTIQLYRQLRPTGGEVLNK